MSASATRPLFGHFRHDASFAIRQLNRTRSFAIAAVLTLAVGIGATTAVFSVIERVVLQPLPFRDPDRVVNLHPTKDGAPVAVASNLEFASWRGLDRAFSAVAGVVSQTSLTLSHGEFPEVVLGARATSEYFEVLGVAPEIGRGFALGDDRPGAAHVVVLSHALWMRVYNGQQAVLGQSLRLDGESYQVIGVMPASFDLAATNDALWIPLTLSSTDLTEYRRRYLQVVARLTSGTPVRQATVAIAGVEASLAVQNAMWGKGYSAEAHPSLDDTVGNVRSRLFILFGAVLCVFFIACVNVANLQLTRGNARAVEMAIRTALGADRRRIAVQLLTESAMLSALAGVVGVALAYGLVRALVALSPPGVPRIEQVGVDARGLLFTVAASVLCSVIVGLFPALRTAGGSLQTTLREGGKGTGEGRGRGRVRSALVATEVALAMTLLSGAALLIRTAWEISHVDPGFDPRNVLTAQVLLPPARYQDFSSGIRAFRAIRDNVSLLPGVERAALTSSLPMSQGLRSGVGAQGQPMTDGSRLLASVRLVTPGYFSAMKIVLREGGDFTAIDNQTAPNVAIINEALARRLWPGETRFVGKRIEGMDPSHQHFMDVIGVIADPHDISLDAPPDPEFYIPLEQTPAPLWGGLQGSLTIIARTASDPMTMTSRVRAAVDAVDPSLPIANVRTMDDLVRTSRATGRFNTVLLSALGAIALLLASVGVYGVVAYTVSQRTREIGLRMALGATPAAIAALVMRRALSPIVVGAAAGAGLSVMATRLLREQLYHVSPGDPVTLIGIAALLVGVSLIAVFVPTRRAMRISPVTALA
ncbi:MAG: ABC transporter permease [bacterium]